SAPAADAPAAAPPASTNGSVPPAAATTNAAPDYDDAEAASDVGAPTEPPAPARAGIGPMLPGAGLTAQEPASPAAPKSSQASEAARQDDSILAEDWWSHSRPIIEIHGYFRTRAELFHNFSLGRANAPDQQLWPRPPDGYYTSVGNDTKPYGSTACTAADATADTRAACSNKTQSSANLRLRLNPEIHVSDNLRIMTQIDILDNLVLGSTPSGYANTPSANGYSVAPRSGYNPLSFFDTTQAPPSAGINGYKDSVRVKRAWAEYSTPVGQLRFGRMPDHFGMGMLHNAGDGYDHDYQSTVDRIMFITDIRPLDLHIGGSWDFPSEGPTSERLQNLDGQAYDLAQLDDVKQYSLLVMRRKNPQLERMALTRGDVVLNFGAYVTYRTQMLASDGAGPCSTEAGGGAALGCRMEEISSTYTRRHAYAWTPDLWGQVLYKGFRFEMEAATIQGKIDNTTASGSTSNYNAAPGGAGWRLNAWGVATQLQQKLLEDKLDLSFGFGWASGDPNVDKGSTSQSERGDLGLTPGLNGLQEPRGSNSFKTFRFHPSYQMDLIMHRNLLTRVQGTYYFRPSIGYDFMRKPNGQRLGGNVAGIWSRASEYIQAPGHKRDLGIELDGSVYFQSKDGVLNDRPGAMGGFFTMLQYGLLFPMDGMGYPQNVGGPGRSTAQIVRWYMGVFF
ncbi:MAG TPA: TIGR04551 family protein, partial [Polyangiaceae bacterium]